MSFCIHKPVWRPAFPVAHRLNVRTLAFGAVGVGLVAGERLANVTKSNRGETRRQIRFALHDRLLGFEKGGATPIDALESAGGRALASRVHGPERWGVISTSAFAYS